MRRAVAVVARVASLLLAVAILVAGYWWGVFVWSAASTRSHTAEPRTQDLGGLPLGPWAVVLAAIPATIGAVLIGISRRSGDSHHIRADERGRAHG